MGSEKGLEEKWGILFSENEALNKRGTELMPSVLAHFNDYIDTAINPSLPEGYSVNTSDEISYLDGKYTVCTGCYQIPSGSSYAPLQSTKLERTVTDLFDKYEEKAPWIEKIIFGFDLSI